MKWWRVWVVNGLDKIHDVCQKLWSKAKVQLEIMIRGISTAGTKAKDRVWIIQSRGQAINGKNKWILKQMSLKPAKEVVQELHPGETILQRM